MAQLTYPGVYIEEFAPGAPIAGVGTSTAAFLGPAAFGPPNEAVKLTSWDAFKAELRKRPARRLLPLVRRPRVLRERRHGAATSSVRRPAPTTRRP